MAMLTTTSVQPSYSPGDEGEVSYNHEWKNAMRINDTFLETFAVPRHNSTIWFLGDLTKVYIIVKVLLYLNISSKFNLAEKRVRARAIIVGAMAMPPHLNGTGKAYDACWQSDLSVIDNYDVLEFKCFPKKYRYLALCVRRLTTFHFHEFQVLGSSNYTREKRGLYGLFTTHERVIPFFSTLALLIFILNVLVCTVRSGSYTSLAEDRKLSSRISKRIGSISVRASALKNMMLARSKTTAQTRESRLNSIDFSKYLGKKSFTKVEDADKKKLKKKKKREFF